MEETLNIEKEIAKTFVKEKVKATYDLAEYLTKKYDIITIGEKEREMYVYKDGYYRRAENLVVYPEIQRVFGSLTTKNAKTETFHKIADMTSSERNIFTSANVRFIPLANGVYDFVNKELLPHDPKYRFKYQFPITYDVHATCNLTEAFLDQVLTPEQRLTVEEWLGYYFYRNYMFKKAIIFVGEGDTGKTTLLEVITFLLGKDNMSSVSLHKMISDKFSASHLYEKHGNIVDELSAKDITDTGNFKMATGGGSITGEYKFGNQFSFVNFSKFTFACNRIPDVEDFDDEAYFNRWMVIRFEKTIEKKIPNFIATITTEEERSGLFNLAMRGLERLLREEHFTYASTAIDTKLEMMRNGSSIARFVKDRIYKEIGKEISKDDMYKDYAEFCDTHDLRAETIISFGKTLKFYASYVAEGLVSGTRNGIYAQVKGWRNVALRLTEEQMVEQQEAEEMMDMQSKQINNYNEQII